MMIHKIDTNSQEFQDEFKNTVTFTDKVCSSQGFVYNHDKNIIESIQVGLTRNKIIYGKRYCPCFMVEGKTKEEQKEANNRLCPCKPALSEEIPSLGHCHCGIFCSPEYAHIHEVEVEAHKVAHTHSRGLHKDECESLLANSQIDSTELESLLEARELGFVDFILVDTREWMEWTKRRIKGTDFLVPTTSFHVAASQLNGKENTPVVVYCLSGSRSAYCQDILLHNGFKQVINLAYGISSYTGECESGE
jgi:ferredoxin-thioredoxin reductase catalytic subunit/rhodanese-related sulfurtransferase